MTLAKWCLFILMVAICLSEGFGNTAKTESSIGRIDLHLSPEKMAMTFLHLPDGEAALIQGHEKTILVNGGGRHSEKALRFQLKINGVTSIDTLILTNFERPYRFNIKKVVQTYHIKTILTTKRIHETLDRQNIQQTNFRPWVTSKPITLFPLLTVTKQSESHSGDINFILKYGSNTLLYLGDQTSFESSLHPQSLSKIRIVKLSQFGTVCFKDQVLFDQLDPEVAILFKQKNESLNERLIKQLREKMIETYNISHVGHLTFIFTKDSYSAVPLHSSSHPY